MLLSERKVAPQDQSSFVAEIKTDGYRVLAEFGQHNCELKSKNGARCSAWFAEVSEALAQLSCGRTIVDGEMAVLDDIGRSDFDLLHARARRRRFSPGDPVVTYCVFDLLVLNGVSMMQRPLIERKAALEQLLTATMPEFVMYVRHISPDDCDTPVSWLFDHALTLMLEGVVGKRIDSPYLPGERSANWFKLKRPGSVPPGRFRRARTP